MQQGNTPNRRVDHRRRELLERTKAAVALRIARVCAHLEAGDLDALVTRMAEIEIKYTMRRRDGFFPPQQRG